MTMKLVNCTVVPAQPGYVTVYDMKTTLELAEAVVAWRVETTQGIHEGTLNSASFPITAHGDVIDNCVGVQQPDGQVLFFGDCSIYPSLEKAIEARFK